MVGKRHGKQAGLSGNGEPERIGTELELFDTGGFPYMLIQPKVAVFIIPNNRIADSCKVNAYLMHTTAMQPNRKQAEILRPVEKRIGT